MLHFILQTEAADVVAESTSISLLDMATRGGWLMLVLLALSLIAVYIFGERLVALHKATKTDPHFKDVLKEYIHDGKLEAALYLCQDTPTTTARLMEAGVRNISRPATAIRSAMENQANAQVAELEKGLPAMASISGGAPMIGFLGTVVGMIQAFYNMSIAGTNIDITLLSDGIYTAMVTTVGGLVVGIPAYFAYNYLSARVDRVVNRMERDTLDFLEMVQESEK